MDGGEEIQRDGAAEIGGLGMENFNTRDSEFDTKNFNIMG